MGATFCSSLSAYSWMVSSISRPLLEISESWPSTAFLQPNAVKGFKERVNDAVDSVDVRNLSTLYPKISPKPWPSAQGSGHDIPAEDLDALRSLRSLRGKGELLWHMIGDALPKDLLRRSANVHRGIVVFKLIIGISLEYRLNVVKVETVEMIILTT